MQSKAATVDAYLAELPDDRRVALEIVRRVIRANLDRGYEEGMQCGMIGYFVPHRIYPAGYHCDPNQPLPFVCLASHKHHMSLSMMSLYGDSPLGKWFQTEWKKSGKKLDMGKSCIRFKKAEDLALEVIGEAIRRATVKKHIEYYERAIAARKKPAKSTRKTIGADGPKSTAVSSDADRKKATTRKKRSKE